MFGIKYMVYCELHLTGVCLITYIDFSSKPDLTISPHSGGLVCCRMCLG